MSKHGADYNEQMSRERRMKQFKPKTDWLTVASFAVGLIALIAVMLWVGVIGDAIIGLLELK